jgi:hypothetical protein
MAVLGQLDHGRARAVLLVVGPSSWAARAARSPGAARKAPSGTGPGRSGRRHWQYPGPARPSKCQCLGPGLAQAGFKLTAGRIAVRFPVASPIAGGPLEHKDGRRSDTRRPRDRPGGRGGPRTNRQKRPSWSLPVSPTHRLHFKLRPVSFSRSLQRRPASARRPHVGSAVESNKSLQRKFKMVASPDGRQQAEVPARITHTHAPHALRAHTHTHCK